jgi:hypothetical protein
MDAEVGGVAFRRLPAGPSKGLVALASGMDTTRTVGWTGLTRLLFQRAESVINEMDCSC